MLYFHYHPIQKSLLSSPVIPSLIYGLLRDMMFNFQIHFCRFVIITGFNLIPFWSEDIFFNISVFLIYLFLAAVGLPYCKPAFSSCSKWGLLSTCDAGISRHCSFSCCKARALVVQASVVVAHGLSCPEACRIVPDQGLNPCPLHWQVDS